MKYNRDKNESVVKGATTRATPLVRAGGPDNNFNINGNNNHNLDNNNGAFGMVLMSRHSTHLSDTATYINLCSYDNLLLAYEKARKGKTTKEYVIEFEKELKSNILTLRSELLLHSYAPKPLVNFTIRDPKTRKISKSDFRDRIVHHALCNIIEPIFEKTFIHDSYANRIGKGTLNAIKRFDHFKRKVSKNSTRTCFVLKADVRHYFDTVNHEILLRIIKKKIKDKRILWLIRKILSNHNTKTQRKGMPLGNLTSQFFANVYLNELDQYVKHKLKAKYYIRYVDDFVILYRTDKQLERYKAKIDSFLKTSLELELHPDKSKIITLKKGIGFLGLRIFPSHKLLKKTNIRKFKRKLETLFTQFENGDVDYDKLYDFLEGWTAYSRHANTYNLKKKIVHPLEKKLAGEISTKEINRLQKTSR